MKVMVKSENVAVRKFGRPVMSVRTRTEVTGMSKRKQEMFIKWNIFFASMLFA